MSTSPTAQRGAWGRWQRWKNGIIYHGAMVLMWLVARLPHTVALGLGSALGLLGWLVARGERRKTLSNIAIAYPDFVLAERRLLGRRCFVSLGRRAAEVCRLGRLDVRSYVAIEEADRRRIDDALAQGKGLIWVTAHLGNWELLAVGLAAHGYDVRPIAKQSYDGRFTQLIDSWRLGYEVRTLWRGKDDLLAGVPDALRSGAILGLLIDQDTRIRGCFVPFFGRSAWTPSGAAELARQTGAPAVVGFIRRRRRGGHVIEVREPVLRQSGEPEQDDRRNTAVFTAAIEQAVRSQPEEWVWMHQRWRTRQADIESSTGESGAEGV